MAKMPHSCEDHRQPSLIRGCDHLIVADGTAGLDHGCRACLYSCQQPIGEWEEGVGCDRWTNRPCFVPTCLIGGVLGFPGSDTGRFQAVHLTRANTSRATAFGVHNSVCLHMLGDRPGEQPILQLLVSRFSLRHNLQRIACNAAIITSLEQYSTRSALHLTSFLPT